MASLFRLILQGNSPGQTKFALYEKDNKLEGVRFQLNKKKDKLDLWLCSTWFGLIVVLVPE